MFAQFSAMLPVMLQTEIMVSVVFPLTTERMVLEKCLARSTRVEHVCVCTYDRETLYVV